jgi:chromosome segregation ATPase
MLNEKQKSTADNNIAEIELFLKEEERERELERQHKNKYVIAGEECRLEIQTLDREADGILKEKTLRAKKVMLKESNTELAEKEEVYDLLTDRLRNLEQECSNLIQEKKELQDSLDDQKRIDKELSQAVAEAEEAILQNRSNADSLRRVAQELAEETLPVQGELEKCKGRIPMVQRDI